ncbi:MAG: AlpA family phage regulatory protein [Pseudomonadota bacterium]|nr:AlpA family phage regulatory protein [Pseudomonadota bacterium]
MSKKKTTRAPALFLSDFDLGARYSVSRATIWRWAQSGRLPKPVALSPGCTRWRLEDVEASERRLVAA